METNGCSGYIIQQKTGKRNLSAYTGAVCIVEAAI